MIHHRILDTFHNGYIQMLLDYITQHGNHFLLLSRPDSNWLVAYCLSFMPYQQFSLVICFYYPLISWNNKYTCMHKNLWSVWVYAIFVLPCAYCILEWYTLGHIKVAFNWFITLYWNQDNSVDQKQPGKQYRPTAVRY